MPNTKHSKGGKIGRNRNSSYTSKGTREKNKRKRMERDAARTKVASCGHASRYIKPSFSSPGSWFCTKCKENVKV